MSEPVTLSDLQKMHRIAAVLLTANPVYLPIFNRIEHELAVFEAKDDAISRARAIAALYRATG